VHPWKPKAKLAPWPIKRAFGFDINGELIAKLRGSEQLQFATHDVLTQPQIPNEAPSWIISNPPYDVRLSVSEGLTAFTEKLSHSLALYAPTRAALIVPRTFPELKIRGLKLQDTHPFSNGGIAVEARVFR